MTPLVSYPRTGSHWLRAALEAATGRPTVPLTIFGTTGVPTLIHTHDLTCTLEADRAVYLWRRDPVAVVRSNLVYRRLPETDDNVADLAREYRAHVTTWLERGARDMLVVTYESMQDDLAGTVKAVAEYVGARVVVRGNLSHLTSPYVIRRLVADKRAVPVQGPRRRASLERFRERHGPAITAEWEVRDARLLAVG